MRKLRLGEVLGRSFAALSGNLRAFGILVLVALVPTVLPLALSGLASSNRIQGFGVLVTVLLWLPLWGAVMHGTALWHERREFHVVELVKRGLARTFPLLVVGLLVLPVFLVLTGLWIAAPITVHEQSGVLRSLGRSWELTRGNRLLVLALQAILLLLHGVAGLLALLVLGIAIHLAGGKPEHGTVGMLMIGMAVVAFITAAACFHAVVMATTHHQLRLLHGGEARELAATFD